MLQISVKNNKGKLLESLEYDRKRCTIGRSGKNDLQLKGWRIAGTHTALTEREDGIYVSDMSGAMDTLVNGEAVSEFGPLSITDEITIGSYRLTVSSDNPAEEVAPENRSDRKVSEDGASPDTPISTGEGAEMKAPAAFGRNGDVDASPAYSHGSTGSGGGGQLNETHDMAGISRDRFIWHQRIHDQLMDAMDIRRVDVESMDDAQLTRTVKTLIREIIAKLDGEIPAEIDRDALAKEALDEAIGLGPLEDLLADDSITEIMVNQHDKVYYERGGKLHRSEVTFSSNEAVLAVIERIVSPLGRRIDESSPMVDGRLKDGSRVNAIIPPLAIKGPCLTIRKFSKKSLSVDDLIRYGSISPGVIQFLQMAVANRKNIIISGGTGSGKTTFLNLLSSFVPHSERIVTVEDSAELRLEQPHVVSLEGRPPNLEGKGMVSIRDLVKNCLRMRPDRIVVGECRGGETLDMLQAMNTGHDGSLTTVHANSPRDLISRLEVMVMMAGMELPEKAILEQIASAVDIVVQQSRFSDGSRKITHVTEVTGMESGVVQMQNIFVFKQSGLDKDGRVIGTLKATGRVPEFYEELRQRGLHVDMSIFEQDYDI